MRLKVLALTLALSCAGCASNSGVQPYSGDVLFVARQGATAASSPSDLRGAAMNQAREYCEGQDAAFRLVEVIEVDPPYIFGRFPRAEVRFRCEPRA
jgi:hypothetical protein